MWSRRITRLFCVYCDCDPVTLFPNRFWFCWSCLLCIFVHQRVVRRISMLYSNRTRRTYGDWFGFISMLPQYTSWRIPLQISKWTIRTIFVNANNVIWEWSTIVSPSIENAFQLRWTKTILHLFFLFHGSFLFILTHYIQSFWKAASNRIRAECCQSGEDVCWSRWYGDGIGITYSNKRCSDCNGKKSAYGTDWRRLDPEDRSALWQHWWDSAVACLIVGAVYSGMGPDFRIITKKAQKKANTYYATYHVLGVSNR